MRLRLGISLTLCTALLLLAWGPSSDLRASSTRVSSVRSGKWSDPATWADRSVPSAGAQVTIARGTTVEYDVLSTQELASVEIAGVFAFSRIQSTRLDVGNIFVRDGGVLNMGTADRAIPAAVVAEIRFVVPKDAIFVGGDFAPSDIGLWVLQGGRWDVHGTPIQHPWAKLARTSRAGEASVVVREDLRDWPRGATVMITPTSIAPGDAEFEERAVASVRRQDNGVYAVTLAAPLAHLHDGGGAFAGEVALLTRNVRITSKYTDRPKAHTMFMAGSSGQIAYAEFKDLGTLGVLGRYPIHFHMMGDTSRGMSVRGASIWRSGNHFLNVHGSNGIRVEDSVGYDAPGSGFFIESSVATPQQRAQARTKGEGAKEPSSVPPTREERSAQKRQMKRERNQPRPSKDAPASGAVDNAFIHNLAAKGVWQPGSLDGLHRVALFWIGSVNATLVDNVAVGAKGRRFSSGFHLAEHSDRSMDAAPLVMLRNEAHSNADHGFFSWNNQKLAFDVVEFRAWRNGQTGMALGAYNHRFRIFRATLSNNGEANLAVWVSRPWIQDVTLEGSKVGLFFHPHSVPGSSDDPGLVVNAVFRGHTEADVAQDHRSCQSTAEEQSADSKRCPANYVRFVRPQFHSGRAIDFGWHENAHSWIEVVDWANRPDGVPAAFRLMRKDRSGSSGGYTSRFDAVIQPLQVSIDLPPAVELSVTADGGQPRIRAQARDDRGIAAVEFFADGELLGRVTSAPYEIVWSLRTRRNQPLYIYARAVDSAGNVAYSQVIRLELPAR